MFRSFVLFCFVTVFAFSTIVAQDALSEPEDIKATPEILALFEESLQSLTQAEPNLRAGTLFQWLNFAVHFDNKAPARTVINRLLEVAPAIEPVELRHQLYTGVSFALYDLEEYALAAEVLQRITQSADRYRRQLDLAVRMVFGQEQDETLQPFDVTGVLRQVISGATEAQDRGIVALAHSFLGRELARQGNTEASVAMFAEAIRIARGLEDVREQLQAVQWVIQSQVRYDKIDAARATSQTFDDPEFRRAMTGVLMQALIEYEKYDEAEALIKTLPADGAGRDLFIERWIVANIDTVTDAKVGEFVALLSDVHRERFLQALVTHLQQINRGDVAVQVSRRMRDRAEAERGLFVGKVRFLLAEQKFAEAIQAVVASNEEEEIKLSFKRQVLMMQFDATREEAVVQQILATYTGEDRVALAELREEATRAVAIAGTAERMQVLFEILQDQFQMVDLPGGRQTLRLISEELDKLTNPVQIVDYRLRLAQFQTELRDNEGVIANLGKLMQRLAAVRDLNELRDLVPVADAAAPVEASAIRSQLSRVYLMTADALTRADAPVQSKQAAFENAKAMARLEPNAIHRAEKLLMLAQFLAEEN